MLKRSSNMIISNITPSESKSPGSSRNGSVPAPLHNVPLQHGFPGQNASEAEAAQVQRLKAPVQDQFRHGATHGGGLLQAVAAETGGKVQVVDERVKPDDAVLVEGVVVVETRPRAGHLGDGKRGDGGSKILLCHYTRCFFLIMFLWNNY